MAPVSTNQKFLRWSHIAGIRSWCRVADSRKKPSLKTNSQVTHWRWRPVRTSVAGNCIISWANATATEYLQYRARPTTTQDSLLVDYSRFQLQPSHPTMGSSFLNKKRERSPSPSFNPTMTSFSDNDEYDRAVAFLQEFRSRRVAALHSTSLNTISESLDDLASDFSLAVGIGSRRKNSFDCIDGRRMKSSTSPKSPAMKKTFTTKCLADLDDSSTNPADEARVECTRIECSLPRNPTRPGLLRSSKSVYPLSSMATEIEADHYFGYCYESPMNKRHRGRLGRAS